MPGTYLWSVSNEQPDISDIVDCCHFEDEAIFALWGYPFSLAKVNLTTSRSLNSDAR